VDRDNLATRLIESEQRLSSLPEVEDRLERTLAENTALRAELESTRAALDAVTRSPSWRITKPLRQLRRRMANGGTAR
jgi:hypothetical protein